MDGNLNALTTIFTEFYYWVTVVFIFLIHVGFCLYEGSASRHKNHMHTLMKNVMIIPLVTITFFLFCWWIYWTFSNFPLFGTLDLDAGQNNLPWSETMGTNLSDHITGVFWAAFLLFFLDCCIYSLRLCYRTDPVKRVLDPRYPNRLCILGNRRGIGLALCRMDGERIRLS